MDSLRVYPRRWTLREAAVWGPISRAVTGWAMPARRDRAGRALVGLAGQAGNMSIHQDELADAPDVEAVQAGRLVRGELGGSAQPRRLRHRQRPGRRVYDPGTITALAARRRRPARARRRRRGVTWPSATDPDGFRRAAEGGLVDATGRFALMQVAPHGDARPTRRATLTALMERKKREVAAAVPGGEVLLTGAPAAVNEFMDALYGPFPLLVLGVLVLTFVALMRAFRSWLVPLTAGADVGRLPARHLRAAVPGRSRGNRSGLLGVDHDVRGVACGCR